MNSSNAETFNDGLVTICRVANQAPAGAKPREKLVRKGALRYRERTVGIQRHYAAMQAGAKVDLLLRVPYVPAVSAQDVAIPSKDGKQYRIELVQKPEGIVPAVMDLTLKRLEHDYDLA